MSREVVGVMPDGVKILKPVTGGLRTITDAEALEAVRKFRTKGIPMGSGWRNPTTTKMVHSWTWASGMTAVSYGPTDWPSQSYRLWVWEAE
jgi:hypothetical protein